MGDGHIIWGSAIDLAWAPLILGQISLSAPGDYLINNKASSGALSVLCVCTYLKPRTQQSVACSELACQFYFLLALLGKWRTLRSGGKQTSFVLSRSVLAKFKDNLSQIFPESLDPYAGLTNLSWCADVMVTACQLTEMFSFSELVTKTTVPLNSLKQIHYLNEHNKSFCHSLHFSSHF